MNALAENLKALASRIIREQFLCRKVFGFRKDLVEDGQPTRPPNDFIVTMGHRHYANWSRIPDKQRVWWFQLRSSLLSHSGTGPNYIMSTNLTGNNILRGDLFTLHLA